jgi:acyl carrier protein
MPDILERVSNVLATSLHVRPDRITEAATFGDLAATSLDMVETVMSLEDEFKIEISDNEAEKLHTVGDVMALVRRKLH